MWTNDPDIAPGLGTMTRRVTQPCPGCRHARRPADEEGVPERGDKLESLSHARIGLTRGPTTQTPGNIEVSADAPRETTPLEDDHKTHGDVVDKSRPVVTASD